MKFRKSTALKVPHGERAARADPRGAGSAAAGGQSAAIYIYIYIYIYDNNIHTIDIDVYVYIYILTQINYYCEDRVLIIRANKV